MSMFLAVLTVIFLSEHKHWVKGTSTRGPCRQAPSFSSERRSFVKRKPEKNPSWHFMWIRSTLQGRTVANPTGGRALHH